MRAKSLDRMLRLFDKGEIYVEIDVMLALHEFSKTNEVNSFTEKLDSDSIRIARETANEILARRPDLESYDVIFANTEISAAETIPISVPRKFIEALCALLNDCLGQIEL